MKSILRRDMGSPLILGLVASVLIALGSLGVGWIGPGSNVLDWSIFDTLRSNDLAGRVLSVVVISASMLLIIAWLKLGSQLRAHPEDALRRLVTATVAWAIPLSISVPLYTRDMFAYVAQGRLMQAGLNPYYDGISALPGWFNIGVDPMWANSKTPYGPLFLWIEQGVVTAAGSSSITAVALFRVMAVVSALAMAFYAYRIARLRGIDPVKVLWLVAASPLILFNFVVGGHNDALMMALLLGGVYYALTKHPIVATVLVTFAIGVKPIALLALPIVGIIWAGQNRTLRSTVKYWLVSTVIATVILGALGFITRVGFGWIFTLTTPGSVSHWYAPITAISGTVGGAFNWLGWNGEAASDTIRVGALGLMVVVVAWIMLTRRPIDPLMRMALAFTASVFSSTAIHPWYAAWIIILFAIIGVRAGLPTHLVTAGMIFFSSITVAEVMDISDAVQGDVLASIVRSSILSGGAIAIIIAYCIHEDLSLGLLWRRLRQAAEALANVRFTRAARAARTKPAAALDFGGAPRSPRPRSPRPRSSSGADAP